MERKFHCGNWKKVLNWRDCACLSGTVQKDFFFFSSFFSAVSSSTEDVNKPCLPFWFTNVWVCKHVLVLTNKYVSAKFYRAQASKGCISHLLMNFDIQHKPWLLFSNGQQFSIQICWQWIEVSRAQNSLSAVNEYKIHYLYSYKDSLEFCSSWVELGIVSLVKTNLFFSNYTMSHENEQLIVLLALWLLCV